MPLDLRALWNFADPAASERAFEAALTTASADDALILRTQIARTHGLRGDFAEASRILAAMEGDLATAAPAACAHHALESGRTHVAATHVAAAITDQARRAARVHFTRAHEIARGASLDALSIDALHMLAIVEVDPAEQLRWNRQALATCTNSGQPEARRWEASLRNNIGCTLHEAGELDAAMAEFNLAVQLRAAQGDATAHRIARWMVAWTLRSMGRLHEALAMQLALEAECDAAGAPDKHVFKELAAIHQALGDLAEAQRYTLRGQD